MVSTKPVEQVPASSGAVDARKALVSRVIKSTVFAKSERLSSFLACVCELTLNGRAGEINEQKIGTMLFDRAADYDSSIDGIVRTQASRLRQRLDLYFSGEGAAEPIRIVLPRGSYVPIFEPQRVFDSSPAVIVEPAGVVAEPAGLAPASGRNSDHLGAFSWRWLPWGLSFVLVLMLVGLKVYDRRTIQTVAAAVPSHPLWSHLFARDRPTMVVAPDSGLVLFHGLSGQDVDLKGYLDAGYRSESDVLPQIGPTAPRKGILLDLANRRYTSIVDLKTILGLKDRALSLGSEVSVRYARDLRPNDFKTGNAILLGSSEADPWDEMYEHTMNFVFKDDYKGIYSILNRDPQKGEPTQWESRRDDPGRRVYGVVAYMPSLAGDGNVLLLEGTGMSGAEAGMDFVLDEARLLPFLKRIKRPDGTLPHFQLLLETHNIGASAVRSQILAWRVTD